MTTTIKATKDLYNQGKCFTKGKTYEIAGSLQNTAGLIDRRVINDQGEAHVNRQLVEALYHYTQLIVYTLK